MSVIAYFGGKSSNTFIEFINKQIPKTGIVESQKDRISNKLSFWFGKPGPGDNKTAWNSVKVLSSKKSCFITVTVQSRASK